MSVLALGVAAPIADMVRLSPVGPFVETGVRVVGVVVAVVGIVLTLVAQLAMGDSWRIGVDPRECTTLVTGGVFGLVRNPVFAAALLTSLGVALTTGNVIALPAVVGLLIALELQVRHVEEPYLRAVHGAAYAGYSARVGRFVPGIGKLRPTSQPSTWTRRPARGRDPMSAGHGHGSLTAAGRHRGRLVGVLAITGTVMVVQVIGALMSGSIALLADAGHNLADTAGVALALVAIVLAARPAPRVGDQPLGGQPGTAQVAARRAGTGDVQLPYHTGVVRDANRRPACTPGS